MTLSPKNITKRSSPRKSRLIFTACASPSGASCGMKAMLTPQRPPSPTAARISGPVSPVTMPMWVMPASRMASMTRKSTGLLATGISCLALVNVSGYRRVPLPPLRMRAFMRVPFGWSVGLWGGLLTGIVTAQRRVQADVVERDADHAHLHLFQKFFGAPGVLALGLPCADDEQHAVEACAQHDRAGPSDHRRRVKQHDVGARLQGRR